MKRLALLFTLAVLSATAQAAPFIACDLDARATHTQMQYCASVSGGTCATWGAWGSDTPAVTVGAAKECRHDIAAAPVGASIVRVKAVEIDPAWGRQESAPSAPFAFSRPASPTSPAGLRLAP